MIDPKPRRNVSKVLSKYCKKTNVPQPIKNWSVGQVSQSKILRGIEELSCKTKMKERKLFMSNGNNFTIQLEFKAKKMCSLFSNICQIIKHFDRNFSMRLWYYFKGVTRLLLLSKNNVYSPYKSIKKE